MNNELPVRRQKLDTTNQVKRPPLERPEGGLKTAMKLTPAARAPTSMKLWRRPKRSWARSER